ncbi:MAG: DUF4290 domain-containing protein [Hyphomicrobiales bacterium]
MEYNTTRNRLMIPEYGRNIQKLIEYAIAEEDRDKRSRFAYFIVNVMAQMHPQVKESGDYKHKLWDHLHIISDFRLDIDAPFPPPNKEELFSKPERLSYSNVRIKFRHYGKNLVSMIEKAIEFPEGEEKKALTNILANHMKKSYLSWNRDSVNDELIRKHLELLSDERLDFEDVKLASTSEILKKTKKRSSSSDSNRGKSSSSNQYNQRRPSIRK